MDNAELLKLYLVDTYENIDMIANETFKLESFCNERNYEIVLCEEYNDIIQSVFRAAHTIKGAAASIGFNDVVQCTHKLEDLFDLLRGHPDVVTKEIIDLVLECIKTLEVLHESFENQKEEKDLSIFEKINKVLDENKPGNKEGIPEWELKLRGLSSETSWRKCMESINPKEKTEKLYEKLSKNAASLVDISIKEDCPMPAVRCFQVMNLMPDEKILFNTPSLDVIEEGEWYGEHLYIVLKYTDNLEEVISALYKIEDISNIDCYNLDTHLNEEALIKTTLSECLSKENISIVSEAKKSVIKINTRILDELMNEEGELLLEYHKLENIINDISLGTLTQARIIERLQNVSSNINKILYNQQSIILEARMIPLGNIFKMFPRMVREISNSLNKKVRLVIEGEDVNVDRAILGKLEEPLKHILRNCLDHGIELPDVRIKNHKKEEGTIKVRTIQENGFVVINVIDDGIGMDVERIKEKLLAKKYVDYDGLQQMSDNEILNSIFISGFSTNEQTTELSGRGVGMDIVKNTLMELNGSITVASEKGKGSSFVLKIPNTLAISKVLLVEVANVKYVILFSSILEILDIDRENIETIQGKEYIKLNNSCIARVIYLSDITEGRHIKKNIENVVIVHYGEHTVALVVDKCINQVSVVIEEMSNYLKKNVKFQSGIVKLGDGSIPIVVNIGEVIEYFI